MKAVMFGGAAAVLGGVLYGAGVFDGGEVYNLPVAQVYAKLEYMPMPPELKEHFEPYRGDEVRVDRVPNESVTWRFTQEGHELAQFRARLSPEGAARTRVNVDFEVGDDAPALEGAVYSGPFVAKLAEIFMTEQVDSQLENRPYDKLRMAVAVQTYITTHPGEVDGYLANLGSMAADLESMQAEVNETFEQVRDDAAARKAAPMTDLSKYNN